MRHGSLSTGPLFYTRDRQTDRQTDQQTDRQTDRRQCCGNDTHVSTAGHILVTHSKWTLTHRSTETNGVRSISTCVLQCLSVKLKNWLIQKVLLRSDKCKATAWCLSVHLSVCLSVCPICFCVSAQHGQHTFWPFCPKVNILALTLLVGNWEEHPACKNWVMRCWHGYQARSYCKWFAYGPADAIATPHIFFQ